MAKRAGFRAGFRRTLKITLLYQFHAQKALFKVPKICNITFWIENDQRINIKVLCCLNPGTGMKKRDWKDLKRQIDCQLDILKQYLTAYRRYGPSLFVLDSSNNVSQGGLLLYIQFFPHKVIYGHWTTETLHASQVTQKSIFVRRKLVIRNYYVIAAYMHGAHSSCLIKLGPITLQVLVICHISNPFAHL